MKKIVIIILILIVSAPVFGQQTDSSSILTRQDYMAKSKNQKKAAIILLVDGAVISGIGLGITLNNLNGLFNPNQPNKNGTFADVLTYSGLVIAAVSIPLFFASSKNEKKAISMSFKNQLVPQFQGTDFIHRAVPSLHLKINI